VGLRKLLRKREQTATQQASVDARGSSVFVIPISKDPDGIGWFSEPVRTLDERASAEALGAAVREALGLSLTVASRGTDSLGPTLRAAGVRSWAQYVKGLRSVHVAREGDEITVMPQENRGARHGLAGLTDQTETLESPSSEALGTAVKRALGPRADQEGQGDPDELTSDEIVPFGLKTAWLALRTERPRDVATALGLVEVREESWRRGLDAVERADESPSPVFITPPVDGWTLVVLPDSLADVDESLDLEALSRRFGEAQSFHSHRVSDYYAWQRWVDGSPRRRYAWIGDQGEIPYDEGEPAAAEAGIVRRGDLDGDLDVTFADEDVLLDVAAEWSIDPMTLGERPGMEGAPLVGRFPPTAAGEVDERGA